MTKISLIKVYNRLVDEKGYTLVELLTVFGIAGFLFVMTMSVWLFGLGYFNQWSRNVQNVNKLHVTAHGLSEEIYRAREIHRIEDDRLELIAGNDSLHVYTAEDGVLLRNGRPILSGDVDLVRLVFKKTEKGKRDDTVTDIPVKHRFAIGIDLTIAAGGDTLHAFRMVYPRKPFLWDYRE